MTEIIHREAIYLWYYFDIQIRQIFAYWIAGIVLGSCISVFAKDKIHALAELLGQRLPPVVGIVAASALGVASPLCMYGTIPICAAFSQKGVKDDFLAAFMMSSILLNPQLIMYSAALGPAILTVRVVSCFACGIAAGMLVRIFFCRKSAVAMGAAAEPATGLNEEASGASAREKEAADREGTAYVAPDATRRDRLKSYFDFSSFDEPRNNDTDPNMLLRLVKNIARNVKATGLWFLLGVALSAAFQRYVPSEALAKLFGKNEAFGILMAATVGVPLYVCGGGTIPLLIQWLADGMSAGSAAAFMITGPATKITNLGALKIALGIKNFALYIAFIVVFSFVCGGIVNVIL
ncbi:MAG: permease [Treponema sp.]|nr:permease [Treponema sp.]